MLAELFQLDDVNEEVGNGESLRGGGSEDSYSDEEEEEEEDEDEDDSCSYDSSSKPQDDSKAVAVIKSVGELSVPEKYKSTHQIRVRHVEMETFSSLINICEVLLLKHCFFSFSLTVAFLCHKTKRRNVDWFSATFLK